MKPGTKPVFIGCLGSCEHCEVVINISDFPAEAMNADWVCLSCGGILTHKSFGYASEKGDKVKWVGPEGELVDKRPEEDFIFGNLDVCVNPIPYTTWR